MLQVAKTAELHDVLQVASQLMPLQLACCGRH